MPTKSESPSNERQRQVREDCCVVRGRSMLCWKRARTVFGGCHGDDEKEVFHELCQLVDDVVRVYLESGKPLPSPVCGTDLIHKLQSVA